MHHASNDLHFFFSIRHRNQHRVHCCHILNSMFQIELIPEIKFGVLFVSFRFDNSTFILRIFFKISLIQFIRFVFASFESVHSLFPLFRYAFRTMQTHKYFENSSPNRRFVCFHSILSCVPEIVIR